MKHILLVLSLASASTPFITPAFGQESRAEELTEEKAAKLPDLKPYVPSRGERAIEMAERFSSTRPPCIRHPWRLHRAVPAPRVISALGAAERLKNGSTAWSRVGAEGDLQQVSEIARQMVVMRRTFSARAGSNPGAQRDAG